jgi:predicted metal-dependent hydrolase
VDTPELIFIGGRTVPYAIVRSDRARLLRLRVGPEPLVRIVVPRGHHIGPIGELLERHKLWIFKQLDNFAKPEPEMPVLRSGDVLPYLGRDHALEILTGNGRPRVSRRGDRLTVRDAGDGLVSDLVAWYRDAARDYLCGAATRLARQMDVRYGRITIRDQKTRWGSCSSRGNLNFSWRLVMAPPEIADYVVIHELAHLVIPHHGPIFWNLVESHCPDCKCHQRWLRDNGPRLAGVI